MATVARPTLLASSEGLADAGTATFEPPSTESWEVHSIIVSGGPVDVQRNFDPNTDGTFTGAIAVATIDEADELHGLKLEIPGDSARLEIVNNSGGSINVYIIGSVIT